MPLKVPRKVVKVYDEGTPNQQYITHYTDTIQAKVFRWVWNKIKGWPGQAKYIPNPMRIEKVGPNTYQYPENYVHHHYSRKWGYCVEDYTPKITLLTPNYAYRWFIDWYGGEHGRTLIKEKNKR